MIWLKCCFTSTETVGLLGTGAQNVHLDFHTDPELSSAPEFNPCTRSPWYNRPRWLGVRHQVTVHTNDHLLYCSILYTNNHLLYCYIAYTNDHLLYCSVLCCTRMTTCCTVVFRTRITTCCTVISRTQMTTCCTVLFCTRMTTSCIVLLLSYNR